MPWHNLNTDEKDLKPLTVYKPHHEKIYLRGLQPGKTETRLLSYRD